MLVQCTSDVVCTCASLFSILIVTADSSNVQGVVCPNEAEFCGYDILFHLTDGDVLK